MSIKENINTVKVNPYEIAKASDMDFGFKNLLQNFSILTEGLIEQHNPVDGKGKAVKDFIIGGDLVKYKDKNKYEEVELKILPMLAFNKNVGLLISNGFTVDNDPLSITLGENMPNQPDWKNIYRIDSIYIGLKELDENSKEKDVNWDEFQKEWRAYYKFDGSVQHEDNMFAEFSKRQRQAIRLYSYYDNENVTNAAESVNATKTPVNSVWNNRVKIAEVLLHWKFVDNWFELQDIKEEDIRFVTAKRYWGESSESEENDHNVKIADENIGNLRENAEFHNYFWTQDTTRTYRLCSLSEMNDRFLQIHKNDGKLRDRVVKNFNIQLYGADALTSTDIILGKDKNFIENYLGMLYKNSGYKNIDHDTKIADILLEIFYQTEEHFQDTSAHKSTSEAEANRIVLRDSNAGFDVETPEITHEEAQNSLKAVNLKHLHRDFYYSVVREVLITKYITNQEEFDTWINQTNNKAYTNVILEGEFSVTKTIKLGKIGTKKVTSSVSQRAYIRFHIGGLGYYDKIGIDGDNIAEISNLIIKVSGRGNGSDIIGINHASCINCNVKVIGFDGVSGFSYAGQNLGSNHPGGDGANGITAIGFLGCTLDKCQVYAKGGNAGDGGQGADGSVAAPVDYDSSDGGNGGRGGDAMTMKNCVLVGSRITNEILIGGDGGRGGKCGEPKWIPSYYGKLGDCGDGGNGGDVYYSKNKWHSKVGKGGGAWYVGPTEHGGYYSEGELGENGKFIKID